MGGASTTKKSKWEGVVYAPPSEQNEPGTAQWLQDQIDKGMAKPASAKQLAKARPSVLIEDYNR